MLAQAQAESAQINATFEALLRIAQIEAGARRARFAPVSLGPIIETIVEVYGDPAIEGRQRLSFDAADDLPPVAGDKELLTQLFANLVENSLRHGGKTISVKLVAEGGACLVSVDDDGPGIPADERDKVFRRLYRLDKSRSTPGSGLGLSLVKAIADLHGATITLSDNAPGLGVKLSFPVAPCICCAGCLPWRMLPPCFPPVSIVRRWFYLWRDLSGASYQQVAERK